MLDLNLIRKDKENIKQKVSKRKPIFADMVENIVKLDNEYRSLLAKIEENNALKNKQSKLMAQYVANKNSQEIEKIKNEMALLKKSQQELETKSNQLKEEIDKLMLAIPNLPHDSVPTGKDETQNVEIKKWGNPTKFNFKFKAHWDLADENELVDFERATKLTGSRFTCYTKNGAKLLRALIQYTLDSNSQAGFDEMLPAVILNSASLTGTGQLPKFEEDLFKLTNGYYLSPTAEVQLTNFHSHEILEEKKLPIRMTANTCCFRSEAGSAGRDTKGIIRQHQFYKTEMVILSLPDDSYNQHELMTRQAEKLLEDLNLPYRRIVLCTGDMGFGATKTYDLEVWLPSYNAYKEISSCSNCEAFQARRMMLRFKNEKTGKNEYVHTLNGSGLAIDRLWAAVVENYQQEDGSIKIPEKLQKYMNGLKVIPNGKK